MEITMKPEDLKIINGENSYQTAEYEINDKTIDYETSEELTYTQVISLLKGLNLMSEFYDVKAACTIKGSGICAVALGPSLADAVQKTMDSNPIDFMNSVIVVSSEVDSEIAKFLKNTNIIAAPKYTKNAIERLESCGITYVTIHTPLKEYKKYLSDDIKITPLGTLRQSPNLSELDKDKFKVVSKQKPTVEQIEDAIFAWKVAKHAKSNAIVVAKDFKTKAIILGTDAKTFEKAMDEACEKASEAVRIIIADSIDRAMNLYN